MIVHSGWLEMLKVDGLTAVALFDACLVYLLVCDYFSLDLGTHEVLASAVTLIVGIVAGPVVFAVAINNIIRSRSASTYWRREVITASAYG